MSSLGLFDRHNFQLYLDFVVNRHQVWLKRQAAEPGPWSEDPILASRKFTNVFRVLDPGSQFIFDLDDARLRPEVTLMRLFLYRHTGRVEAWEYLKQEMGDYPETRDLEFVLAEWQHYRDQGNPIFTGAYLVYPQSPKAGTDKLESIIRLTQRLFDTASPECIVWDFLEAKTQKEKFEVLRRTKGVADFMSMQILTDWGYTRHAQEDLENEFVVPGPGARRGIMKLVSTAEQKKFLWFAQAELLMTEGCPELDLGSRIRTPSIMDVQNTMCEFGKYVRFIEQGKTEFNPYVPAHPGHQPVPRTPKHWA